MKSICKRFSLVLFGFLLAVFSLFTIFDVVGEAINYAEEDYIFQLYELESISGGKRFIPKTDKYGNYIYYDFRDPSSSSFVTKGTSRNGFYYDATNPKNLSSASITSEKANGTYVDYTKYGTSNAYNYIGANFFVKEMPDSSDLGEALTIGERETSVSTTFSGSVSWTTQIWNSLQVNTTSGSAPKTFNLKTIGKTDIYKTKYRMDKIYAVMVQSVFATQNNTSNYQYYGTVLLGYLKPCKPEVVSVLFTDKVTSANNYASYADYKCYYQLGSDIIYCLTVTPKALGVIENFTGYDLQYNFNDESDKYKTNSLEIIQIDYLDSVNDVWRTCASPQNLPLESSSSGTYKLNFSSIDVSSGLLKTNLIYRVYFRYNFDMLDESVADTELINEFESSVVVKINANIKSTWSSKYEASELTRPKFGIGIGSLKERGNL